ncbi:MAG: uncharacterized membrane protein (UPF0127 family) [Rhodothermales bacterium]|jgi:uncharacterized membrane protein (UPF0127 family)
MRSNAFFSAIVFLAAFVAGCAPSAGEPDPGRITGTTAAETGIPFRASGSLTLIQEGRDVVTLDIEIADTDSSRSRGLMQRESLPDKSGMLFVFEQSSMQGFYMANTLMSLDFFFIGADSVIVNTVKYAPPLSLETIPSTGPALWVLEVPAGFIDNYGLVAGDQVTWTRNTQ